MKKWIMAVVLIMMVTSVFAGDVCKIGFMLEMQKKLNLTEKQVADITALHDGLKKSVAKVDAKYKNEEVNLKKLMGDKTKNLKKIKSLYNKIALLDSEKKYRKLETEVKAYNLLNKEQKDGFQKHLEKFHQEQMVKEKSKKFNIYVDGKEGDTDAMVWMHKGDQGDHKAILKHLGEHGDAEFIDEEGKKHIMIKRVGEDGKISMDIHKEFVDAHKCENCKGEGECDSCKTSGIKVMKKMHEGAEGHSIVIKRMGEDGKMSMDVHMDAHKCENCKGEGECDSCKTSGIKVMKKMLEGVEGHSVIIKRIGEGGEMSMDVHMDAHKCENCKGEGECENCKEGHEKIDVKVMKKIKEGGEGAKVIIEREIKEDGKVKREKKEYDIEALIKENEELKAALKAVKAKK